VDVGNHAVHRITIHVNVEDVHENRETDRGTLDEARLIDRCDHDELSVGGRYDERRSALTDSLRVSKEVGDPERQQK
jgi:hypothetical protein